MGIVVTDLLLLLTRYLPQHCQVLTRWCPPFCLFLLQKSSVRERSEQLQQFEKNFFNIFIYNCPGSLLLHSMWDLPGSRDQTHVSCIGR